VKMRVTSAVAAASVIANEAKQSRADETLTDQDCFVALGSSVRGLECDGVVTQTILSTRPPRDRTGLLDVGNR